MPASATAAPTMAVEGGTRMTATQRRLAIESAISIVPNALVSALFVWLIFRGADTIPLWGTQGVAFDLLPTTFMLTLMTTIALTLIVRARRRKGLPAATPGSLGLPRNVVLRAVALALLLCVVFVPATVLVLGLVWDADWSYDQMMVFKIAYGISVGLVATPLVVLAALRD